MFASRFLTLLAGTLLATAAPATPAPTGTATAAKATPIQRIDPTFWWVGMKNPKLQLLVHGPGIRTATASMRAYPGVRLYSVQQLVSPNYLVLHLPIAPEARAGRLQFDFKGPKKSATPTS